MRKRSFDLRIDNLTAISKAGSGHPGGSLSVIDLVTALYFSRMRHDPKKPHWPERDRFVLSKGTPSRPCTR